MFIADAVGVAISLVPDWVLTSSEYQLNKRTQIDCTQELLLRVYCIVAKVPCQPMSPLTKLMPIGFCQLCCPFGS